ncbi:Protein MAIN-LIKE 1 [Glycine max]|nr:Protein MAIN-LIKE 1 [Glycine max]
MMIQMMFPSGEGLQDLHVGNGSEIWAPEIEGLVAGTRLSPLIACSVDTGDQGLISAFMERWHKETNSFHLPIGELMITLDDVASLLHLPVIGAFHSFKPLLVDEAVLMLVELLEVSGEEARAETAQCCTLFANKSATHVHVVFLDTFRDLSQSESYAWGAASLVHMYDHLNDACKSGGRHLAGYITLLQWIATKATSKSLPASTYRKRLDALRSATMGPVVVTHQPERVVWQFSWSSFEDIDDRWMHYSDYLAAAGQICLVPGQCASDYMDRMTHMWSHISLRSQWHQHQHRHMAFLMWTSLDMAFVEACQVITERLVRLLNLRIVTAGTEIHEVMEDCIRITRDVTPDGNVYVRSRRRRRMDQP